VQQGADALVLVGCGVSYSETADRLRVKSRRGRFEQCAQLVANWVEVLGPVAEPQIGRIGPPRWKRRIGHHT
jgi:hypothetical protein